MRLYGIVPYVIGLLQCVGRVTYDTLKHDLGLDDALLEVLRRELIFQGVAVDEDGIGLVWTGEVPHAFQPTRTVSPHPGISETTEHLATRLDALAPLAPDSISRKATAAPQDHSTAMPSDEPTAAQIHGTPEAERRQVTVLFCDLVDSTQLASQLDPEDYRAVIRAYQEAAVAAIQPFGGYVAQYLGDGLLLYFGWPQAHEDAASRAVHASLAILAALGPLNSHLEPRYGVRVAVRLGLHTGLAVIGAMGSGTRQEALAMGDTPNIAARLQGLAEPDTVVLSAATARLVQGAFALEDLGTHALKGVAEPMPICRLLAPLETSDDEAAVVPARVSCVVGRDEEVGLLRRRWEQSKEGLGQVVLISGEAGIGKSALVQTLRAHIERTDATWVTCRCSPYHTNSALYPVIEHLHRALQWQPDDTAEAKLDKLERALRAARLPLEEAVPLLAALLSVPLADRHPPVALTPQQQKQQTLDTLVAWLLAEAERQPVLVLWEDVHWADPTTLELLGLLVDQVPTVPMLHVLTFRPAFAPPWPPRSHMTPLTLSRLERPQVEALITHLAGGKALPAEVVQHIVAKTDGVPLFVEELSKMLLESGLLREEAEHYALTGALSTVTIPTTLQDSLMARLDRYPAAREVAQLGAVLGREFPYAWLRAVSPLDATLLEARLVQLVAAELLYHRGRPPRATYTFKHALIQDAAYASLLRSTRQQYHQRLAQMLETRFAEMATTQPELLAHHYTEAGLPSQAAHYWQQAGQRALQRSANVEAIAHAQRGLDLLTALPDTLQRAQHELSLLTTMGQTLQATRGYAAPEAAQAYTRARELCQQVDERPEHALILFGLWRFYIAGAQHQAAMELGEQCLQLAQRTQDAGLLLMAHILLGISWFYLGNLTLADSHLQHTLALYAPEQYHTWAYRYSGTDPGLGGLCYHAWLLWLCGYPEQARAQSARALSLAEQVTHPQALVRARVLSWDTLLCQLCRDTPAVRAQAEAMISVATAQRFALLQALGPILRGWAIAIQEHSPEGLGQIWQGLAAYQTTGAAFQRPHLLALLAEAAGLLGQPEEGLAALDEALTLVQKTGERYYEAELHRQQGELLLQRGARSHRAQDSQAQHAAERCFQHALDVARQQQARSLELRAAMSLARLWQQQDKRQEARQLLAEIYGWFTEGFDTPDLQEARALLEGLTGPGR